MSLGMGQRCGRWLDHHKEPLALVVSAITLVFFKDFLDWVFTDKPLFWGWRAGGGAGLMIGTASAWYGANGQNALRSKNAHLEEEVEELEEVIFGFGTDYFSIWVTRLQVLAEELNLNGRDRISVYRHEENVFTMVGRFAILPELKKPGRSVYPVDQGVIGAAWRSANGQCVIQDLPDATDNIDAYCARNESDWQLPSDVVREMNMKARSIAAFALNDTQNSARHAIIVFESTSPNRFKVTDLEKRVRGSAGKEIVHLLEIMRNREPSLAFAQARGF